MFCYELEERRNKPPTLKIVCTNGVSGEVYDLTGCRVTLIWKSVRTGEINERPGIIWGSPRDGTVLYHFAGGEIESPVMDLEVLIEDAATNAFSMLQVIRLTPLKRP